MSKVPKTTSLQDFKENKKDEFDLLPAGESQRFLQIDTIILRVCGQAWSNYPKNKFAIYLQYLEKKVSNEVDSLCADKHESLLQIDTMTQFSLRRMQSHA